MGSLTAGARSFGFLQRHPRIEFDVFLRPIHPDGNPDGWRREERRGGQVDEATVQVGGCELRCCDTIDGS